MSTKRSHRYDIYEEKITTFANQMLQAYEKTNILKGFCHIKSFDIQRKDFSQIAKRVTLPKKFFFKEDNVDNSVIAEDFTRAIVTGERDFVLKAILEAESVPRNEVESFDYEEFATILSKMDSPTHIFIPIKPYFKPFYDWVSGNKERVRFEHMRDLLILVGNKEVQVHWITSDANIDQIIVVNKDKINVIQKIFEQSDSPKGIKPIKELNYYSKGKKLMLYFTERDAENFDFVFRTVISKPELKEGSAIIINVKNKPKENEEK